MTESARNRQAGSQVLQQLVFRTHAPGAQRQCIDESLTAPARDGLRLMQAWATEGGLLNRIVCLWEGEADGSPRDGERAFDWLEGEPVARRLVPRRAVAESLLSSPLLELRMYAARPGRCEDFVAALLAALPFRERYSPCAGLWTTHERGFDVAVHLWAYDSLDARMRARQAAIADADWARYLDSVRPWLQYFQSMLLVPVGMPGSGDIGSTTR